MRRSHVYAAIALAVYATALAGAWTFGVRWESRKTRALLVEAQSEFVDRLENLVNAVQWFQCAVAFDALGGRTNATERSVAEMRAIADRLYIDEINVVSTNGIVIASNLPKVLGDDWHSSPNTAAFLELLSPDSRRWRLSQPFRHGTVNPEYYCTYHAQIFDDRSGILEVGYSMDRLAEVISYSDGAILEEWLIGRHGYYAVVDEDGDTVPDKAPAGCAPEFGRMLDNGEIAYRLRFSYAGRLFQAIVPAREYGGQRRHEFFVFAATSGLLIFVFALILFLLSRSNRRVVALRRAADARQASDLASARTIQLSSLPNVDRYRKAVFSASFAALTDPAREVGGDFYDFYFTDSTHLAVVVADVAGKGIAAAMFMMRAKNVIFNALCVEHDLAKAVAAANARICEHNEAEMFVTAWVGVLDVNSGEIEYVNAGHNRPFLRRADGRLEKLMGRGGRFLGMFPDATYRTDHVALGTGEFLFLFTDGVTEAMNVEKQSYGEERLCGVLSACEPTPERILADTAESVHRFTDGAEQSDDLTGLALVWHGTPERRTKTFPANADSLGPAMAWLKNEIKLANQKSKMRILNASDEIMANIVSYSGSENFTLTVENSLSRARLTITDNGREYNPLSHVDPNTHVALEERPEGGLGILMTKRLVDAVHYVQKDGRNIIKLVKLDD